MLDAVLTAIAITLGVKKEAIIIGLLAAIVSLKFIPDMRNWYQKLSMAFGGFLCAVYLAPAIAELMEFKTRTEYGITFLVGLSGMSLAAAVTKLLTSGELWEFFKKKWG